MLKRNVYENQIGENANPENIEKVTRLKEEVGDATTGKIGGLS